jgi:DNA polymerase-3 subunit alpha (Gram-positive type)
MTKMFFDVFPTLEVNGDMKKLLSETEVTRVGMNHEKDHIRIYLNGTRLIHKKNIYQLEKNIHDQIFKNRHMDVKVIEKYQLSEQYTAEKLMDKVEVVVYPKKIPLGSYGIIRVHVPGMVPYDVKATSLNTKVADITEKMQRPCMVCNR